MSKGSLSPHNYPPLFLYHRRPLVGRGHKIHLLISCCLSAWYDIGRHDHTDLQWKGRRHSHLRFQASCSSARQRNNHPRIVLWCDYVRRNRWLVVWCWFGATSSNCKKVGVTEDSSKGGLQQHQDNLILALPPSQLHWQTDFDIVLFLFSIDLTFFSVNTLSTNYIISLHSPSSSFLVSVHFWDL